MVRSDPTWRMVLAGLWLLLAVSGAAVPLPAEHTVLILSSNTSPSYKKVIESCKHFMAQQDQDTQFISLSLDDADEDVEKKLAAVSQHQPSLVFALGSEAAELAARSFPDKPVVATMVYSRTELERSTNVTGVALEFPPSTQLQWIRRMLPQARRIAVLYDPAKNQAWIESASAAATEAGLLLVAIPVASSRHIPGALKRLAREADVLWAIPDTTVFSNKTLKQVMLSSFRNKIPLVGLSRGWVKAGALYALDRDYEDLGRQNCIMMTNILSGQTPANIAPETPKQVVYSLNLKTARQMKQDIDEALVAGAGKLYK